MVMMVSAHFLRDSGLSASPGAALAGLDRWCEAAPAWFFLAFGLTFSAFCRKDPAQQRQLSGLLLATALAHNVVVQHRLWTTDFLFLIWFWQTLLAALERELPNTTRVYAGTLAGSLLLLLAPRSVDGLAQVAGQVVPGFFPLWPWGLFVLAGVLVPRWPGWTTRRLYLPAGAAVLLGLSLAAASAALARPGWLVTKQPLTAPYLLLFSGLALLLVQATRDGWMRPLQRPRAAELVEFLSRNLLLATVLHYWPEQLLASLVAAACPRPLAAPLAVGLGLLGSAGCVALLVGLMRAVLAVWARWQDRPALVWLRARRVTVSVIVLGGLATARAAATSNGVGMLVDLGGLVAMAWFCLELGLVRRPASEPATPCLDTRPPAS